MEYKNKIIKGTFWVSLSTFFNAFAQIFRLAVLTRFLPKSDFGLVAILTFVLGITYTFSDLGFSSALMHKKNITQKEFSSLYWIQLLCYISIYLVVIQFSYHISIFFDEERIEMLLPLVLLDMIFHGIGKLYETLLHKNFYYKTIAFRNIFASLFSLFVAIFLAINGYGIYSLIFSTLCQSLSLNLYNFIMGQKVLGLKLYCSYTKVKALIRIGIYQTGGQILDCISGQLDVLIIGKAMGLEELGVYNLAKELFSKVKMVINSVSNKVMLPIFADIQDDVTSSRTIYLQMIKLLGIVNIPISSLMGLFSFLLIPIIYGDSYRNDFWIFTIMSVWAIVESLGNPIGNIVAARGRTDLFFKYTFLRMCVYIPGLYIICKYGVFSLVVGVVSFSYLSNLLACQMILKPVLKLNISTYQKAYLKLFVTSMVYMFVFSFFLHMMHGFCTYLPVRIFIYCIVLVIYLIIFYEMEKNFVRVTITKLPHFKNVSFPFNLR